MPPTSVLRSRAPLVLTLVPPVGVPALGGPPGNPVLLPGNPPSVAPAWPYIRSISRPSTALTRPTANSKSGRNLVRGVPLVVAVPGEVAVVEIPAHRGDLVEEAADGHLRGRGLGDRGRDKDHGSEHCKDGNTSKSSHSSPEANFGEAGPAFGRLTPTKGRLAAKSTLTQEFPEGQEKCYLAVSPTP